MGQVAFFRWWVVVTHLLNLIFPLVLARSGIEVPWAFPKLYWHEDCPPKREWLPLSKTMDGSDSRQLWTCLDVVVATRYRHCLVQPRRAVACPAARPGRPDPGDHAQLHPGLDRDRRSTTPPRPASDPRPEETTHAHTHS